MQDTKPFKTFEDQKSLLTSYKLKFKDDTKVIETLKKINYFDLINGFETLYVTKNTDPNLPKKEFNDIYFEEFVQLYKFDKALSSKIFLELSNFEEHLKTAIAYYFAKKHCSRPGETMNYFNCDKYLKPTNNDLLWAFKNFKIFQRDPHPNYSYKYLSKIKKQFPYVGCYVNPPFWVTIKTYDMGSLYFTYEFLTDDIKKEVLKDFGFTLSESELFGQIIWLIKEFRNTCAHTGLITHLKIQVDSNNMSKFSYLNRFNELYTYLQKDLSETNLTLYDLLHVLQYLSQNNDEINITQCINFITNTYNDFQQNGRNPVFEKLLDRMGNRDISNWKNLQ